MSQDSRANVTCELCRCLFFFPLLSNFVDQQRQLRLMYGTCLFFGTESVLVLKNKNWFCLEMCVRRVPIKSKWEYVIRNIRNAIVWECWEYWEIFNQIFAHLCTHLNVLEWLRHSAYRLIGIYLMFCVWWMEHLILEYHYYYVLDSYKFLIDYSLKISPNKYPNKFKS